MKSFFLTLALLCAGALSLQAGYAPYTERGTVDFDVFYNGTQPHGKWAASETYRYIFTPKASIESGWRPYREGHWVYTDNGWTWKGAKGWDWATDHYGFWTKRSVASWSWVPGDQWLPASVEWIQSGDYIGWRACELDRYSNMMESEEERYKDPSEWNFIPKSKMTETLKPSDFATDEQSAELLKNRAPADHIFVAWREIPRPGPAPWTAEEAAKGKPTVPALMNIRNMEESVPVDTKDQVFVFRPTFYQDMDGVFKRIEALLKGGTNLEKDKMTVASALTAQSAKKVDPVAAAKAEERQQKETRRIQADQKHMQQLYK